MIPLSFDCHRAHSIFMQEFVPRFDKHCLAERDKRIGVYGLYTQVFVGLTNKKVRSFIF